jgi:hypothetical protein
MNRYCSPLPSPIPALQWPARVAQMAALFLCLSLAAPQLALGAASPPVDREAQALVQELLAQRPVKELAIEGVLKLRDDRKGRRSEVPMRYSIQLDQENNAWRSVYEAEPHPPYGPERLIVHHQPDQPNRYEFIQTSPDGQQTNAMVLTGNEAALPFAGSDYWLSDLGMEFLHWSDQRLVRDAKITMRLGRPCRVLASYNPFPAAGNYARVVSWIDAELGNLIYAEAYDLQGKRFKVFSLKGFKRVSGRWQVRDMELRNERTDSRTRIEFFFEAE